jgi:uroporphyrinogen decarboxylase-like protein
MVRLVAGREAHWSNLPTLVSMADHRSPRAIVKALVRGEPPARPLLLPTLFSLGARLENVSLAEFQANPTKIANAMRQIHATLKVDGVTCNSDPYLEMEALGFTREWQDDTSTMSPGIFSAMHELRHKADTLETLCQKKPIQVVCEVLRRLKVMLKDEPALMVRVTGPFTLASQIAEVLGKGEVKAPKSNLVEHASELTAAVSKCFLEAGADVILLIEDRLPVLSNEEYAAWASLLSPILNVIKFYEALPVLFLSESLIPRPELRQSTLENWDGVWSLVLPVNSLACWAAWQGRGCVPCLGLPREVFVGPAPDQAYVAQASRIAGKSIFIFSLCDLPATARAAELGAILQQLRSS